MNSTVSARDLAACEIHAEKARCAMVRILGWQWDLDDERDCADRRVDFALLQIPRTLFTKNRATTASHLFLERPRLKVQVMVQNEGSPRVRVWLQKLWYAHPALMPVESDEIFKQISELLDMWAVDLHHEKAPFEFYWFSSRDRKVREIERFSPEFILSKAGRHRVAVKAVDAFGTAINTIVDFEVP
jgi:hypothetical protein